MAQLSGAVLPEGLTMRFEKKKTYFMIYYFQKTQKMVFIARRVLAHTARGWMDFPFCLTTQRHLVGETMILPFFSVLEP
jgi:hypothetical protein